MLDYEDKRISIPLNWVHEKVKENKSKEWMENPFASREETLQEFLNVKKDFDNWDISIEEYLMLVKNEFEDAEKRTTLEIERSESVVVSKGERNGLEVPSAHYTSWQKYKKQLKKKGLSLETIDNIEADSIETLNRLSLDTKEKDSIKGLVVGSVQSGKTTNMAGVMSMAADHGWNTFIVLTGMIEKLREQTEDRLVDELKQTGGNVTWTPVYDLKDNPLQRLNFDRESHIITVLKNKTRLENLVTWLSSDPNKAEQMKIIIIDDEADQASVNTGNIDYEERKTINRLLVNLTNNLDKDGNPFEKDLGAINYVGYTATPYANVLNESSEESLYPRDFITLLKQSRSYIGPTQIFGLSNDDNLPGLDIIRNIDYTDPNEMDIIDLIHKNEDGSMMPEALKSAVSYFIAASASLRLHNYGKPVSMLIHTSNRKEHHENMYALIFEWLRENKIEVFDYIKETWETECDRFTKNDFSISYPAYEQDLDKSYDPHSFEQIEDEVNNILEEISPLTVNKDGKYEYHKGVHMCIDNSDYNTKVDDEHYRLRYPNSTNHREKEVLKTTPLFLVIGGNTLSRGLTIEGLVSTYFLRGATASDSLMQMGRWFGYRVRYEVYPRVWMTEKTIDEFEYLAELDHSLREEIELHNGSNYLPTEIGLKIKTSPHNIRLRLTALNKSQSAIPSDFDYIGASIQTVIFKNDMEILTKNKDTMFRFIDSLGKPKIIPRGNLASIVWNEVDFDDVKVFLETYEFHKRSSISTNIKTLIKWNEKMVENNRYDKWNVLVVGNGSINDSNNNWEMEHFSWNKVERSKLKRDSIDDDIRIKVLRGPGDLYRDIDASKIEDPILYEKIKKESTKDYVEVREELGLEETPQLILYLIDGNSKASKNSKEREDLNLDVDIAGVHISIPGRKKSTDFTTHVTIALQDEDEIFYVDVEGVENED